ncbi:hypothetical protein E4U54_001435 [Claviceps lovelessii]|nr:hypothetical protein E4U54_001435 [Claviceps lovelessii]
MAEDECSTVSQRHRVEPSSDGRTKAKEQSSIWEIVDLDKEKETRAQAFCGVRRWDVWSGV